MCLGGLSFVGGGGGVPGVWLFDHCPVFPHDIEVSFASEIVTKAARILFSAIDGLVLYNRCVVMVSCLSKAKEAETWGCLDKTGLQRSCRGRLRGKRRDKNEEGSKQLYNYRMFLVFDSK